MEGQERVCTQVQEELCQFSQEAASNSDLATMHLGDTPAKVASI